MTRIVALALLTAVCALLLRGFGWKGVPVFISVAFVGLISVSAPYISEIGGIIGDVADAVGIGDCASAVIKVVGVGYLAGITADICRELDAGSIASAVTLAGRIEIIAIAAPYFAKILNLGGELIG